MRKIVIILSMVIFFEIQLDTGFEFQGDGWSVVANTSVTAKAKK